MSENSEQIELGYKSLFSSSVGRLEKLELSDREIHSVDTDFMFIIGGIIGNFANDINIPKQETVESYYKSIGKSDKFAILQYISLLRQCYPTEYYGKDNNGSKWLVAEYSGIYEERFLDKSKWKKVPTFNEFSLQKEFNNKIYNKVEKDPTTGIETYPGQALIDNKYQQYLQDIWPEYWTGKIFSNRIAVNEDLVKNNADMLCPYTKSQILEDIHYAPAELVMTDGHYKALIMGVPVEKVMSPDFDATIWNTDLSLTNLPKFLLDHTNDIISNPPIPHAFTEAEESVQKVIDTFNEKMDFQLGLAGMIKKALEEASKVIVINVVWGQIKDSIDMKALESGKGIDTKVMCKEALTNYLNAMKENIDKMKEQALKQINEKIDEITKLATGVWDNIKSLPKTASSMISTAALPQTIPTTGGIPNPVTVILDVINIIDNILALFPPIINGIMQILTIMKSFVIALPAIIGPLQSLLMSIAAIMGALKSKKKNSMSVAQIHKAIEKANKQIEKLTNKQEKLDKTNEKEKSDWEDLQQTIDDLNDNIRKLEEMCTCQEHSGTQQAETSTEFDFEKELASLNDFVTEFESFEPIREESVSELVINLDNKVPSVTSGYGQSGNIPVIGQTNNSASIIASPLQETNITPYCGKVFTNV